MTTLRAEPEDKGGYCKPSCYILQPDWSLVISKHTGGLHAVERRHHVTTSCGIGNRIYNFVSGGKIIPTCYYRNKD